ncbi:MAG: hypothetical protein E7564_02655 [Ruminococcaceae bacterium]|nr:hypothetical protein [Oscillospiraceae bacterium]
MNEFYNEVMKICLAFLTADIIGSVFPNEKALKWSINIITVYVFLSVILNLGSLYNITDFEYNVNQDYINETEVSEVYLSETEKILAERIKTALNSVYIECEKIEPLLKMDENGEVSVDSLIIKLKYKSDIERAKIVINELFKYSQNFKTEIVADG